MQYKDYYAILGVEKTATAEEIKSAYRKLAKQYHPDRNKGDKKAEEKFKDIGEAYDVLGGPEKRKKYDAFGSDTNFQNGYDFDPSQYGYNGGNVHYEFHGDAGDHSDFFNMFFGGDGGFDLSDLFGGAARGGARGSTRQMSFAGEDIEGELELTPEEGAQGGQKRIALQTQNGVKNFTFKIPKGVRDSEKIRLKGQGHPGVNGGAAGDLYMTVRFVKSSKYRFDGDNLVTTVDLYPWDAALGAKVPVDTLGGGRIMVKVPAGVQSGGKIRIAGKGYPNRDGKKSDLIIEVLIKNPAHLTGEMKKYYEKLKDLSDK